MKAESFRPALLQAVPASKYALSALISLVYLKRQEVN
jgi:hypothetical protein